MNRTRRLAVILLAAVAVASFITIGFLTVGASPAAAQAANNTSISDTAPYYANESADVANESWYADIENGTLDSMGRMVTRFTSFYIGYGQMDSSGTGFEGVLLTGVIMTAMFVGSVFMLPIGPIGGGVLAVTVGYGMTEMGLAPPWFRVLLVFVVGMLSYVAYRQAQQAR